MLVIVRHGNSTRGEKNTQSKLKRKEVLLIKKMLKKSVSHNVIAKQFGVARRTISHINSGYSWGWLEDEAMACSF